MYFTPVSKIRKNLATIDQNRYWGEKKIEFMDIVQTTDFYDSYHRNRKHCDDRGKCETLLLRHTFRLADEKVFYKFQLASWVRCFSEIGGFAKILLIIFGQISTMLNNEVMIYK